MHTRLTKLLTTVALGTTSLATAAAVAPVRSTPVHTTTSVGASGVTASLEDVSGLDALTVDAGERGGRALTVTPGQPWACVSADRSETHEEVRDGTTVRVRVDRRESGCADGIDDYSFDRSTWEATVRATIPTEVHVSVHEEGPQGWELVDSYVETSASASVEVSWQGTGSERLAPWVGLPSICYTYPPSLCYLGGGAAIGRNADVTGPVQLGGLGVAVEVSDDPAGTMHWWMHVGSRP